MWGSRRSRRRSGGWVLTATLVVAAGALVGTGVVPTVARFTGQGTVTGNAFTTRSCVTRSPFVVTGFEFGPVLSMVVFDSSSISSATNAVTDTAVKRTGSYALKLIKRLVKFYEQN